MSVKELHRKPSRKTEFTPKLISALLEGYDLVKFRADAIAGLTVAIVALPLAMAIAIASGVPPERGLYTAIVAGFLISALGGSRFQIGGPTAAFIVVVFNVVETHGYDGLVLATIMAGLMLIGIGLLRLGTYIKYIPYPVITGFTAGIAVSIAASQLKEALGLDSAMPGDFAEKMRVLFAAIGETRPETLVVTVVAMAVILVLRRYRPSLPGFLIAVVGASLAVYVFSLDAATIGTRFGGVPSSLPAPSLPVFSLDKIVAVFPSAVTIALLAGIESLLSAVVADGMTGRRHRSNCELVAQGIANVASAVFGGISATGAIARTATNIRTGARTPVAGMLHAVFILGFMALAAPLLSFIPLAALSAILLIVAWNISEIHHIRATFGSGSLGDILVLSGTFLLTVFADLTVGIEFGVVAASLQFMHRMARSVESEGGQSIDLVEEDRRADEEAAATPRDVVVYRINGPFFFGSTQSVATTLDRIGATPRVFILDLAGVPFMDSTAALSLRDFMAKARQRGVSIRISAARPAVRQEMARHGLTEPAVVFDLDVATALRHTIDSKIIDPAP